MMGFMMISEFMDTVFSDKPMSIVNTFPQHVAVRNDPEELYLADPEVSSGRIPKFHCDPLTIRIYPFLGEAGTFFPVFFHVVPYIFSYVQMFSEVVSECFHGFPMISI